MRGGHRGKGSCGRGGVNAAGGVTHSHYVSAFASLQASKGSTFLTDDNSEPFSGLLL